MSGPDTRALDQEALRRAPFPEVRQGFRIYVAEEAFDEATQRGSTDLSREVGGILVGDVCKDEAGPYVRVDTTIDALHADEKSTELTFTHATWEYIHTEMDAKHRDKRIVGWYHTHPGFGVFLSDRDRFIQRSFFNLPYQIALVFDPRSREHGIFAWRDGDPVRWRRYWVGAREYLWEGTAAASAPDRAETETSAMGAERAQLEPIRDADRFGLLGIGVIVLLVGALAGWWIGGMSASADLERARSDLSLEHARGAQDVVQALNLEVLALLRQVLAGDRVRSDLDEGLQLIEQGLAALTDAEMAAPEALQRLAQGTEAIRSHRDRQARAEATLQAIEAIGRQGAVDPRQLSQLLAEQRAALGQLCSVVAANTAASGDAATAQRLLRLAMRVDAGNAQAYAKLLESYEKEGAGR